MPLPSLREFQISAIQKIKEGFIQGHKNQVVMCPTGGGKTILAMALIERCYQKGKRAVFMADRKTLVNQSSFVADSIGLIDHSVIMASHERFDPSCKVQIASIQTLARRGWPEADLYIIDECHTLLKAWTKHVKDCNGAVIGLSATPFSQLGNYFSNLINAATLKELTQKGILVPMRIYTCTQVNMDGAETKNGEWSDRSASERGTQIIGNVVEEWLTYGEGRKTIVFGADIAHCQAMCREFNERGAMARIFTAYTRDKEREELLNEFAKEDSRIQLLITVEALAKGFDNPLVSCICDVRPLRKSFSTAVQMWGRMLRCAPQKKDAILLDFSGNIIRFGEDFERLYHHGLDSLKDGVKLDKTIRKRTKKDCISCPACGYDPFHGSCMSCGHEIAIATTKEHEKGVMHEVKLRTLTTTKQNLFDQCYTLCSKQGDKETVMHRASHLYKSIAGDCPNHLLPRLVDTVSQEVINQAKYNLIRWKKSRYKNRVK